MLFSPVLCLTSDVERSFTGGPGTVDVARFTQADYDVASWGRGLEGRPNWVPEAGLLERALTQTASDPIRILEIGACGKRTCLFSKTCLSINKGPDLGCVDELGPGSCAWWLKEMAVSYPHAEVIGLSPRPVTGTEYLPVSVSVSERFVSRNARARSDICRSRNASIEIGSVSEGLM